MKRAERVELKVSAAELAVWDAAAAAHGLTRSSWLRLAANNAARVHALQARVKRAAARVREAPKATLLEAERLGVDPAILWGAMLVTKGRRK